MIIYEGQILRRNHSHLLKIPDYEDDMSEIRIETLIETNLQVDLEPDLATEHSNTAQDLDKQGLQYSKAGRLVKQPKKLHRHVHLRI